MPFPPAKTKAGSKRPAPTSLDNMSTPRKRFKINAKSPNATPPVGQITFGTKVPPHGHQVQSATSEQILSSAKKRLFEEPNDSQSIVEQHEEREVSQSSQNDASQPVSQASDATIC